MDSITDIHCLNDKIYALPNRHLWRFRDGKSISISRDALLHLVDLWDYQHKIPIKYLRELRKSSFRPNFRDFSFKTANDCLECNVIITVELQRYLLTHNITETVCTKNGLFECHESNIMPDDYRISIETSSHSTLTVDPKNKSISIFISYYTINIHHSDDSTASIQVLPSSNIHLIYDECHLPVWGIIADKIWNLYKLMESDKNATLHLDFS